MTYTDKEEIIINEKSSASTPDGSVVINASALFDINEILRSKMAVTILSWYVANVTSLALVFWDVFIINETYGL